MSQKFVVSEFTIDIGFDASKALKGLDNLDKRVMQVVTRIEKQLNNAFKGNTGAQSMGAVFKQIQRQADQTSNHIQRAMQRGFAVGGLGGGMFNRYQHEGVTAANAVRDAMSAAARAGRPAAGGGNPRPYTPRANTRLQGAEAIRDIVTRQQTSAFFGNMQVRNPALSQQYTQRLEALRNESLLSGTRDVATFRNNLHSLNFEFAQTMRQASVQRSAQRLNAAESTGALSGLTGAAAAVTGAFFTLSKSLEFFQKSLEEGMKRGQAKTMLSSAYGANSAAITEAVNAYATKFGADKAEAQQQAAKLRFTLPSKQFSDEDIPALLKTESIFSHQVGMTADDLGRLNYAMSQIAASAKLMGQDWMQVVNASPAIIKPLQELTRTSNTRELRDKLKTFTGGEVAKMLVTAMENLNKASGAEAKTLDSMQVKRGQFANAQKDSMEQFYNGFAGGFKRLLGALTGILENNGDVFLSLGKVLGSFFDTLADYIYKLDDWISTAKAFYADFEDMWNGFYAELPQPVQKALDKVGSIFKSWAIAMLATAALFGAAGAAKAGGSWAMRLAGMGGGSAAVAGGAAVAGAPVLPIAGATLLAYYGLKEAGYEPGYVQTNEQGIPGVPAENSRFNQFINWAGDKLSGVAGNYTAMSTPLLPGMNSTNQYANRSSQQAVQVQVQMKTSFAPLTLNIPMPDGSTYTTTAQVQDMVGDRMESILMTSQGLGGGWQVAGQNAGFSPSLLKR